MASTQSRSRSKTSSRTSSRGLAASRAAQSRNDKFWSSKKSSQYQAPGGLSKLTSRQKQGLDPSNVRGRQVVDSKTGRTKTVYLRNPTVDQAARIGVKDPFLNRGLIASANKYNRPRAMLNTEGVNAVAAEHGPNSDVDLEKLRITNPEYFNESPRDENAERTGKQKIESLKGEKDTGPVTPTKPEEPAPEEPAPQEEQADEPNEPAPNVVPPVTPWRIKDNERKIDQFQSDVVNAMNGTGQVDEAENLMSNNDIFNQIQSGTFQSQSLARQAASLEDGRAKLAEAKQHRIDDTNRVYDEQIKSYRKQRGKELKNQMDALYANGQMTTNAEGDLTDGSAQLYASALTQLNTIIDEGVKAIDSRRYSAIAQIEAGYDEDMAKLEAEERAIKMEQFKSDNDLQKLQYQHQLDLDTLSKKQGFEAQKIGNAQEFAERNDAINNLEKLLESVGDMEPEVIMANEPQINAWMAAAGFSPDEGFVARFANGKLSAEEREGLNKIKVANASRAPSTSSRKISVEDVQEGGEYFEEYSAGLAGLRYAMNNAEDKDKSKYDAASMSREDIVNFGLRGSPPPREEKPSLWDRIFGSNELDEDQEAQFNSLQEEGIEDNPEAYDNYERTQ